MSSGAMINNENGQTFSNLFHKFIRMTVKTNDKDKKFKKNTFNSTNEHFSTFSKRIQPSSTIQPLATNHHHHHHSNNDFYHQTFISKQNPRLNSTDYDQQDDSTDESNNAYGLSTHTNSIDLRDMENSFADIGLTITSKPLARVQKYSVQNVLNSSFPRVGDKQQLNNGTRSGKTLNVLNNESSLPFLNDPNLYGGTSARLNQTVVQHSNHSNHSHSHSHSHHHHHGAAALTQRNLRREKTREGSLKSSSKDQDNSHSFVHNTSATSNLSNSHSHQFIKSKNFLNNHLNDNNNNKSTFPIKPTEALSYYGEKLTEYEKLEIFDYNEIYFLGLEAEKVPGSCLKDYDDENGSYIKCVKDHICYRFEIFETLGKGSFGLVLKCFDHKKKEMVALKIIRNKKRFQQQGLVEVNILTHLKTLDQDSSLNLVHIKEHFYFRSHLCITFELLGINLYELIKKNNYQGFSLHLVRRFANSLLQCLRVMFREKIIHCDLKPENILLRQKGSSSIKVIDFGSGCFESQRIYTYIQSRFYRAPEIILGIPYTPAIDMWSFGCILVELFTGYPIFPGENEQEQLSMIMEVVDLPPSHVLEQGTRRKLFFDSKGMPRSYSSKNVKKRRPASRPLAQILRTTDNNFVDFVRRCFEWDPLERLTPEEGLRHPWIIETKLKRTNRDMKNKIKTTKKDENNLSTFNADSYFSLNETTANEENLPIEDDKQIITLLPRISNH